MVELEALSWVLLGLGALVGTVFLGRWIAGRISQTTFERLVVGLTGLGAVNLLL